MQNTVTGTFQSYVFEKVIMAHSYCTQTTPKHYTPQYMNADLLSI